MVLRRGTGGGKTTAQTHPWLASVCTCACTHGVDGGVGVDLQRVDVVRGVLEQAVIWVQHFMTQQVQPLPTDNHMVNERSTLTSAHVTAAVSMEPNASFGTPNSAVNICDVPRSHYLATPP